MPPIDGGSTGRIFSNGSSGEMSNWTIENCYADLANQMSIARLSHQVGSITVRNCQFFNSANDGWNVDDFYGTHLLEGNRIESVGRAVWYRSPVVVLNAPEVLLRNNNILSTTARGISVEGGSLGDVIVLSDNNGVQSAESALYLPEYIRSATVIGGAYYATGSEPTCSISADGVTNRVRSIKVSESVFHAEVGHGFIISQNGEDFVVDNVTVKGGDQGMVIKGTNGRVTRCDLSTGTGSALLVKGGQKVYISSNKIRSEGSSGDIRAVDVREQDAGTLDQQDPDYLTIVGNEIYAAGSASIGFRIDALNVGDNIVERGNMIFTEASATAAEIQGTTVTDSEGLLTAWSSYATPNNGAGTVVNNAEVLIVTEDIVEIAEQVLKTDLDVVIDDAALRSLAVFCMALFNSEKNDGSGTFTIKKENGDTKHTINYTTNASNNPVNTTDG